MDLRVSRCLDLLKSLLQTVSEFAKREDQITNDLRARRVASNRRFNEGTEQAEAALAGELGRSGAAFDRRREHIESVHRRRRERIEHYRHVGTRDMTKMAQDARERWLGNLQIKKFSAERSMTDGKRAVDATYAEVTGRLDDQRQAILTLDRAARGAFRGYGSLTKLLRRQRFPDAPVASGSDLLREWSGQIDSHLDHVRESLADFRRLPLPRLFAVLPLVVWISVIMALGAVIAFSLGAGATSVAGAGAGAAVLVLVVFVLHQAGLKRAKPLASVVAGELAEAVRKHELILRGAEANREQEGRRLKEAYDRTVADIEKGWNRADEVQANYKKLVQEKLKTHVPRALARNDALLKMNLAGLDSEREAAVARIRREIETRKRQLATTHEDESMAISAEEKKRWDELHAEWQRRMVPIYQAIQEMNQAGPSQFPPWDSSLVDSWAPPVTFTPATRFGRVHLDLARRPGGLPKDERLALPGSPEVSLPLALAYPREGSLLFETADSGSAPVMGTINNIILRLLVATPPGKVAFTIIDPVGLGQNFAGLMHLGDYEESLINRRIWTQRDQIEERLAELNEHIEKVIQMYLRNEYATITEYNEQAGSVAEKYHFLVIADFPANFSETAAKRLQSIATSGARCGVFTLIHWDRRQPAPDGFVPDELRAGSVGIRHDRGEFVISDELAKEGVGLMFDPPPSPELAVELVHKIGRASIDSNRVEVPFEHVAPKPEEMWANDTTNELRIAVGRTGATKLQYLAIGKGTRQHALFAGKTGSGKSTLFHVIITNLALSCSPEQVEFYLIDFKKGVEFKCYATKKLPHARVVAIESDREFGLSVLQRVDEELRRRGDLFRKLGVQDVAGYKRAGGTEAIPRTLLIIDEFQEFFVEDDAIAQSASLLFDRIVRQGRAFGIHVLLGSQTLGGAYTLARATLGQMVIRVALQCNEADAYLIMDENNAAPRLLSRPGEGIYNDAAGAVEGNSPFQVVWLPDDERDRWLDKVHELAERRLEHYAAPIVFEGNAPADVRENVVLGAILRDRPKAGPETARIWLGAPNSIKGPTEAVFHRQSGNHLLVVGQREEPALVMVGMSLVSLAAQFPAGTVKFVLIHGSNPGSSDERFLERVVEAIPHAVTVSRGHDIPEVMNDLSADLKERIEGGEQAGAVRTFVIIHGLQKFKKLRHEDDFSFGGGESAVDPGAQLNEIVGEGSSHGMHLILTVDTFNNVNRFLTRKALSEFEMRVVFQMSANDSASLIDSPKASNLGLHRALFYNEHEGYLETFRPYAMPDAGWLAEIGAKLG